MGPERPTAKDPSANRFRSEYESDRLDRSGDTATQCYLT